MGCGCQNQGCTDPENNTCCPPSGPTRGNDNPITLQYRDNCVCHPEKIEQDCTAPVIPPQDCAGEFTITVSDPYDPANPFVIIDTLYDQNCSAITDQTGDPITSQVS